MSPPRLLLRKAAGATRVLPRSGMRTPASWQSCNTADTNSVNGHRNIGSLRAPETILTEASSASQPPSVEVPAGTARRRATSKPHDLSQNSLMMKSRYSTDRMAFLAELERVTRQHLLLSQQRIRENLIRGLPQEMADRIDQEELKKPFWQRYWAKAHIY